MSLRRNPSVDDGADDGIFPIPIRNQITEDKVMGDMVSLKNSEYCTDIHTMDRQNIRSNRNPSAANGLCLFCDAHRGHRLKRTPKK